MALVNAQLDLKLDRTNGTFSVLDTSTRIYSQDENIALTVRGWTLEEVTKTDGKTPYEPYFRIVNESGIVMAECKLEADDTPTPLTDGTYAMHGTLSTNTDKLVGYFRETGVSPGFQYQFSSVIYSTTSANPISSGSVVVYAFDPTAGDAPTNLPSASEVLDELKTEIEEHIEDKDNPHAVTASQTGAYTKGEADAKFETLTAAAALETAIDNANAAIIALQNAVQVANAAISSNSSRIAQKANIANTYRKDEVYTKSETNAAIAASYASHLLEGKTFAAPTKAKDRTALIEFIISALGGNIESSGITPGTTASQITMLANDGTTRNVTVVLDGGEYTLEVS